MHRKPECLSRVMLALKEHHEDRFEKPLAKTLIDGSFLRLRLLLLGRRSPIETWDSLAFPLMLEAKEKYERTP